MKSIVLVLFLSAVASAQWIKQSVNTSASFRGLSVVNEKVVWASGTGGTVIRTTDGGKNWNVITVPGAEKLDFRDIEAFDANTAFILSIGNGDASRIYKTIDGGATWKLQFTNKVEKAFYDAIGCWDRNNCIAMSDPVGGFYYLLFTTDGGAKWRGDTSAQLEAKEGEAAFAASGTCLITTGKSDVYIVSGGTAARVFHSADRHRTWQVADTPITKGTAGSGIFSIAMYDDRQGVIVGGNYEKPDDAKDNLALTIDGGKTWTPGWGLTGYRSGVAYVNSRTVIAVGTNGTDVSINSGRSWKKSGDENLNAVAAKGPKAVWAVGPAGVVVRLDQSRLPRSRVDSYHSPLLNVHELKLSRSTLSATCNGASCDQMIEVTTYAAELPDVDYVYKVSAGRIIGEGSSVKWDLTGVKPGTYTITAARDDGGPWGILGKTVTRVVTVVD